MLTLQHEAEQAAKYAKAAKSPRTLRAYETDWRDFVGWCDANEVAALPAAPPNSGHLSGGPGGYAHHRHADGAAHEALARKSAVTHSLAPVVVRRRIVSINALQAHGRDRKPRREP